MANKTADKAGRKSAPHQYDAIVVGGGHNGLTHAAYLAKAGLRTLLLERRQLVGGAAITEELHPGFSFTTFSYALSLLRPDIVHELDLVKHGFMPLLMKSSFAPMENGDYFLAGGDREENLNEIRRHSTRDADAMERFDFDLSRVQQFVKPLFDNMAPNIFSGSPEDQEQVAWMLKHLGSAPQKVVHDTVRLLFGSIADFVDDYFETEIVKAHLASSAIVGAKLGPMSPGSGLVFLYLSMGEHDGALGSWSFHKGGNGGFTQVLARAAQSFGAEIRLDSAVSHVVTQGGRATGVVLEDGTEFAAPVVVSALDPRRTFTELVDPAELPTDLVENIAPLPLHGHRLEGELRLGRPARLPRAGRPHRPLPGLHQHRADHRVRRAGLRHGEVRLVLRAALPRLQRAVLHRPRHGAGREARDVVLHAVHAVRPEPDGTPAGTTSARTSATRCSGPWSRTSPASTTWCCTARWSPRWTSNGSPG